MTAVTNVVFDIGNVLIRWDPKLLYSRLFPDPALRDWFLSEVCSPDWNLEMDRGRSFAEGIAEGIARHPEWATEIRAWDLRWHEMVPGAIEGSVALLEALRAAGVATWAITNFSSEKFAECLERFPFLGGFRDTVVSAHEKLVKPDPAIYRVLLERNRLDPATCLFVDDNPDNVLGARAVGMKAVAFTSPERFADDLATHGLTVA
ncbi:HAD family hydrolase [Pinisolibacter aquiterrae]|uniref:HAD family hydrolase n=1 Tax=Pinisolibacter aquiterrae TaxID=2815579 RepID=UPI001C3C9DF8|nr:HAD family phosphatase [Pinisolibacter aquiterrae]MBV5263569.1 HAD family phosphatase [Pinisolibacter aquiterrae]MCC8237377.1 HAD family phosphatase [Pinisolibacter aquiterrae]